MAHVPHFRGEILIADNGSDLSELQAVKDFCKDNLPFTWRILEFSQNLGVADSRNRAFTEIKTDWILSLDAAVYLLGDPFPALQRDLGRLGCHFLNIALVNPDHTTFHSLGGHLQCLVEDGQVRLALSSILPPGTPIAQADNTSKYGEAFLCTALFGEASILRRDSFLAQGGFDTAMGVGFEDASFSLKLWRAGRKIGASTIPYFVYSAIPGLTGANRDRTSLSICHDETRAKKPRIALVTDTQDWAYANISRQIMRHLSDHYDFDLIPLVRLAEIEEVRWMEQGRTGFFVEGGGAGLGHLLLLSKEYDLIHVFWREYLTLIGSAWLHRFVERLGLDYKTFESEFIRPACITTSVYDHLNSSADALAERRPIFNNLVAGYTVASDKLDRIYRSADRLRSPAMVIEDGVDSDLFFPIKLERFSTIPKGREVVIGWVGNSKWASSLGDKKGVHTILIPAVEQLRAEGLLVRLELADRQGGFIPHDRMVHYYAQIDVYVCTSDIEGTPNPVLEAMACGIPVVSTDVGIVPQVFGQQQSEFILAERSVECLKEALRRLIADPGLFVSLSQENLERIKEWTWSSKTEKFDRFFRSVLKQHVEQSGKVPPPSYAAPPSSWAGSRLCDILPQKG
jgi:glycosyltransferase involved in cell wall biosynthesis